MLDQDTKRKIDAARDILVGIVPDPKAQVNQITIALMYKFMDDMDRASAQAGGKASFLAGDFSQYSWAKLMDKRLSSAARMDLYVRAIGEMPKNPGIPQLFRDIFKEAFLPFRNARTLNLFLTEIDGFDYDHSENLGNAFEYLLSIMGAQGDAGQFRTPRHIIDFMVEVVAPQKNESILDPACGTAGFLISAYKYIFRQKPALTPQEKTKLTKNIVGYDISPDMVKLALVNMFLHRFVAPKIHEYDALTSEERWGRDFDVVLANPPFMTPKGGIEPHTQFRIRANRAEVLFVDYIAEHLTLKGRAGIVVPEGIIFQSANAYKNLRKALVEEWGLYAVASLPSGVFNPYSGVKTSILFLSRDIAKRTNKILFVKAENDGFDLGAQRRRIEKDDLPACLAALRLWQKNQTIAKNCNVGFAVEKEKIAEGGEYNLTAERYRETECRANAKWEVVNLGDVCEFIRGLTFGAKDKTEKNYILVATTKAAQADGIKDEQLVKVKKEKVKHKELILKDGDFLISVANSANLLGRKTFVKRLEGRVLSFGAFMGCLRPNKQKIIPEFLNAQLENKRYRKFCLSRANTTTNISNLNWKDLSQFKIPLPPLSLQKEIVAEIEQWQKVIDGAKQVTENWKPQIRIAPELPTAALGDVCEVVSGQSPEGKYYNENKEGMPFYQGKTEFQDVHIGSPQKWTTKVTKTAIKNDILMSVRAPVGPVNLATQKICIGRGLACIRAKEKKANQKYVFYVLKAMEEKIKGSPGATFSSINKKEIESLKIPLPPLSKQEEIVMTVEAEQKAVDDCKRLTAAMEKKVAEKIAEVWGE